MDSRKMFELQKLLAEERTRTEQHKLNYQTLKLDHQRMQDECERLRSELSRTVEIKERTGEIDRHVVLQTERELAEAKEAINEINRRSLLVPSELDKLNRYHEEVEKKLTKRNLKLEEETEIYRNDLNALRCEYGFLRAEYENERLEFARQLEEMKLKYESELIKLKQKTEALCSVGESSKSLQRENTRLTQQVAALNIELSELRRDRLVGTDDIGKQHKQRVEQIMELTARLASVELEKSSASHACDKLNHDLRSSNEELSTVCVKLTEAKAENDKLKMILNECKRLDKMEVANCWIDIARRKVEFDETVSRMQQRNKDLSCDIDDLKIEIESRDHLLQEKEAEFARKLMATQLEDSEKFKKLETEKNELEMKYNETEKKLMFIRNANDAEIVKIEEKSNRIVESKRSLETEILILETKLDGHRKMVTEFDVVRQENEMLKVKFDKMTSNIRTEHFEMEKLIDRNERLKEVLEKAKQKIDSQEVKIRRLKNEAGKVASDAEKKFDKQKSDLKKKVAKLERVLKEVKHDLELRAKSNKRRTNQYTRLITKLRNRLELQNARMEELLIERENLQKWVPHDVHNSVTKRLRNLQHSHDEYKRLLQTHHLFIGTDCTGGRHSGALSSVVPHGHMDGVSSVWLLAQQEQSLQSVKERLRQLHSVQTDQLDELSNVGR